MSQDSGILQTANTVVVSATKTVVPHQSEKEATIENDADKGIIISSTEFTKSAINFVQNLEQHIVLLSLQDLIKFDGNFESVLK